MSAPEILLIGGGKPLRKLLVTGGYTVIRAHGASEEAYLKKLTGFHPDLVIFDWPAADQPAAAPPSASASGYGLLKKFRDVYRRPVIVLSPQNGENDIIEALDSGATDYLVKPFRTGELLARIRAALRSAIVEEGEPVIRAEGLEIDLSTRTVKKNNEWLKLTATQYSLLALFGKNAGKVLTHQYLLREIWGSGYTDQLQYLRVFIGQLRKKIERDANYPEHIITESGIGYRFTGG
jgi:two-component system KDP operon response regulator KdpE